MQISPGDQDSRPLLGFMRAGHSHKPGIVSVWISGQLGFQETAERCVAGLGSKITSTWDANDLSGDACLLAERRHQSVMIFIRDNFHNLRLRGIRAKTIIISLVTMIFTSHRRIMHWKSLISPKMVNCGFMSRPGGTVSPLR